MKKLLLPVFIFCFTMLINTATFSQNIQDSSHTEINISKEDAIQLIDTFISHFESDEFFNEVKPVFKEMMMDNQNPMGAWSEEFAKKMEKYFLEIGKEFGFTSIGQMDAVISKYERDEEFKVVDEKLNKFSYNFIKNILADKELMDVCPIQIQKELIEEMKAFEEKKDKADFSKESQLKMMEEIHDYINSDEFYDSYKKIIISALNSNNDAFQEFEEIFLKKFEATMLQLAKKYGFESLDELQEASKEFDNNTEMNKFEEELATSMMNVLKILLKDNDVIEQTPEKVRTQFEEMFNMMEEFKNLYEEKK